MGISRIVQLIPNLGVGGAERMLLHLATSLDRAKYEVLVVSLHRLGNSMERDFEEAGLQVEYLDKQRGFDARMFSRIGEVLKRLAPDLLHTHRPVLQYALPSLLGRLRKRTVHTVHGMAEREVSGFARKSGHWIAIRAGVAPVAICQAVARGIERVYGVPPRAVIPNAIPVARFACPEMSRDEWRSANGLPADAVVFTTVARHSAEKNLAMLVSAFSSAGLGEDGVLMLCGDGELRPSLESDARRLGVADRVRFLGNRPDVPEVLAASDVFVLPSLYEGHPLSVMEAMAAGRAVIGSAVGGIPENVRHGETGLLVPPADHAALAAALRRLYNDAEERSRFGQRGAEVAAREFDVSLMTVSYDRLYQEILAAGSG